MRLQKFQSNDERTILTALVVHDQALGRIFQQIGKEERPFRNRWSNLIAKWCFAYYEKYQVAPRGAIQASFDKFAESNRDPETVELVEAFLSHLNENYKAWEKEVNEKHLIDQASDYFAKIRLERLSTSISEALERGNLQEALEAESGFERVDFSESAYANPFSDEQTAKTFRLFEEDRRLILFPGALNKFLSPYFARGSFVCFQGPEKRGKSYWLNEVVWQALRQRRRVLYYSFGDMSQEEVAMRLYTRSASCPSKAELLRIPTKLVVTGDTPEVSYRAKEYGAITLAQVRAARKRICTITGVKEPRVRFAVAAGGVISASRIAQEVKRMGKEGWPPDVVVIDYADLLDIEPSTSQKDKRHQIDASWQILRGIGLESHCLVVTATQAAKSAYTGWVIRKGDFSEDKRKNAHVTGMLGINQTPEEKEFGVYRLNWVLLRHGAWAENQVVWTAGNLALSNPSIISCLSPRKIIRAKQADNDSAEQN